jgi:hypothetical protein
MRLAMGVFAGLAPFFEQLLPDPLGRSLLLPAMVVYPTPPHRCLYIQRLPICGEPRTRSEADKFPPPPPLLPIPSRSSVVLVAGCQKVIHDEISHVSAQSLAGREVG